MTTNNKTKLLALAVIVSAFLLLATCVMLQKNAYGSEISLQEPWNVRVCVRYGKDACLYELKANLRADMPDVVYGGKRVKQQMYKELTALNLPEEAVFDYILPNFGNVARHFAYVERPRKDATFCFDGSFTYAEGHDGIAVDKHALFVAVLDCIGSRAEIDVPISVDKAVTVAELKAQTVVKGTFSTSFTYSGKNRCHNIVLAANAINGTTVGAGERFSFNEIVGARTEQNGYKNAVVINDGKYVDGVGGGVCQVSTTLYNALLVAEVVPSAHRHTLVSSYVDPGFDAMVSDGGADLTFTNNSGCPLYIGATVHDKTICFTVYGVPNKYRVERQSEYERTPFITEYMVDRTLKTGEQRIVTNGSDGVKSKSYLLYYDGEKLIERRLIRSDTYKTVNRLVAVAEGELPTTESGN